MASFGDPMAALAELTARLASGGFIEAAAEARELIARAGGDAQLLESLVERRLTGEPLAWIVGTARFCDLDIRVDRGVYVPRPQSEPLARRAAARLPNAGLAIDVCTGSGAIARTLMAARPRARVVASDIDGRAVACAEANGVEAYLGDLYDPLPPAWRAAPTSSPARCRTCRPASSAICSATPSPSRPPRPTTVAVTAPRSCAVPLGQPALPAARRRARARARR